MIMPTLRTHLFQPVLLALLLVCATALPVPVAYADIDIELVPTCDNSGDAPCYSGNGIQQGLNEAENIIGVSSNDVRSITETIITTVLSYMALVATIVIVIAGMYLIFSNGDENAKEKAKKIILYTLVGLLIILFARAIVGFVTVVIAQ